MRPPDSLRPRLSLALVCVTAAVMISMGAAPFLNDGSFWLDEASIAYNMISMPTLELFGRLDTGHQFPRLYLGVINQLRFVFGYETSVVRALPFFFFVAGVVLWHLLLWRRFRARPALVLLGALLCMVPGVWFTYAAMFKQYTLDVFVALLPFLLTDETLDRRWRRGERVMKSWLWLLPCLFSLTYGIAWLGRLSGYWLGSARARGLVPPVRATALLALGFACFMAAAWWIDLRHAFAESTTFDFWAARGCMVGGDCATDAGIIAKWVLDWTGGRLVFSGMVGLPTWARAGLVAAFVLGAGALLVAALLPRAGRTEYEATHADATRHEGLRGTSAGSAGAGDPADVDASDRMQWGTRALSALATIVGLFAAGLLLSYPLCAGRLTLFAYFSLVLVTLEGLSFAARVSRRRSTATAVEVAAVLLAIAALPGAAATARHMWFDDSPENIRALLPLVAEHPERRIVVGPCTSRQGLTLPEWLDRDDIFYVDEAQARGASPWPEDTEFWLVLTNYIFCPGWTDETRERAERFRIVSPNGSTATLLHVTMPWHEPDPTE